MNEWRAAQSKSKSGIPEIFSFDGLVDCSSNYVSPAEYIHNLIE